MNLAVVKIVPDDMLAGNNTQLRKLVSRSRFADTVAINTNYTLKVCSHLMHALIVVLLIFYRLLYVVCVCGNII